MRRYIKPYNGPSSMRSMIRTLYSQSASIRLISFRHVIHFYRYPQLPPRGGTCKNYASAGRKC